MNRFVEEHKTEITLFFILIALMIAIFMYRRTKNDNYTNPNLGADKEKIEFNVKYEENEYKVITMDIEDLIRLYNTDVMYLITTDKEEAWNLLTDDAKKTFTNKENYVKYITGIATNNTKSSSVVSYNISKNGNIITYDIVTSENIKYTLVEKGIWNYKISFIKKI